jgi:hypothetical protein
MTPSPRISAKRFAASATRAGRPCRGLSTRDSVPPVAHDTCDLCGGARERSERYRLVWDSGLGTELVLAELCSPCAERPGRLLEVYGGRGHDALRVTGLRTAREAQPEHRVRGIILRGLVYILVAFAAFVVVTSVASR